MAGVSNYLRNKLHDWLHRGQSFTPPATVYLALCNSAPTAASAGTEVSGSGYARQAIPQTLTAMSGTQGSGTTTASTGTSGEISNNAEISFGNAGGNWGSPTPISHWETYDAASGGNRLEFGPITDSAGNASPRTVVTGDPVAFPIGTLKFRMV